MGNAHKVFVEKSEGKRLLGRPRRRWEDNSVMDLREIFWRVVDYLNVAQERENWRVLVNRVMYIWVP
jgi:hypothetical protein